MPIVVGVNFKKAGRVYYFDPGALNLKENDLVIAETSRGIELGEITLAPREVEERELVAPLKGVLRPASPRDIDQERAVSAKEKEAFRTCQRKIEKHGLDMKLIDVEYGFDGTHCTFYFSAEGRIDFRELVKDLAQTLRVKVQLHQVGVRDEAKMLGGLGPCGRPLCCASFLTAFEPVSMKMAKEQSLFLNPAKFSGLCGKLMCCLRYEYEVYREAKVRLPAINSIAKTPKGKGRVVGINVIKDMVMVDVEEIGLQHFAASELLEAQIVPDSGDGEPLSSASIESRPVAGAAMRPHTGAGCAGCGDCHGAEVTTAVTGAAPVLTEDKPADGSEAKPNPNGSKNPPKKNDQHRGGRSRGGHGGHRNKHPRSQQQHPPAHGSST